MSTSRYTKLSIALQHYLLGARYYRALAAYDFARKQHIGWRKDKVTPEFQHQIEIALFITTLRDLQDEEGCIVVALLHDTLEDYPSISTANLVDIVGTEDTKSVISLSKFIHGKQSYGDLFDYFDRIAVNLNSSIVKGCDRIHNLKTMHSAFTKEKQQQYVEETEQFFLPMLKKATGLYPKQHLAYMNIRTMLKTQMELIKSALEASNTA